MSNLNETSVPPSSSSEPVCGCIEPKGIFSFLRTSWPENLAIEGGADVSASSTSEVKEIIEGVNETNISVSVTSAVCGYHE